MVILRLLILNQQLWDLMNLHVPYLVPEAMFKICGTCSCKVEQLSLSPLAQAFHRACTAKAPSAHLERAKNIAGKAKLKSILSSILNSVLGDLKILSLLHSSSSHPS